MLWTYPGTCKHTHTQARAPQPQKGVLVIFMQGATLLSHLIRMEHVWPEHVCMVTATWPSGTATAISTRTSTSTSTSIDYTYSVARSGAGIPSGNGLEENSKPRVRSTPSHGRPCRALFSVLRGDARSITQHTVNGGNKI